MSPSLEEINNQPHLQYYYQKLQKSGWNQGACQVFFADLPVNQSQQAVFLQKNYVDTYLVGSELYLKMLAGMINQQELNVNNSRILLKLILAQLGAEIDQFEMLQLVGTHTFGEKIPPHSEFFVYLAKLVQTAFPDGLVADYEKATSAVEQQFPKSIHQLRMYLDRHNIAYIRNYFKTLGDSDEVALANYVQATTVAGGLAGEKMIGERGRLHNKFIKGSRFDAKKLNRKRLTPDFHAEFILDSQGNFLTPHDFFVVEAGRIISDPLYYQQQSADQQLQIEAAIVNGESFNYANRNNNLHRLLDIQPPAVLDCQLRKTAMKKWQSPKNISEYCWRKLDLQRKSYFKRNKL
ncbi:hypothetical protein M2139_002026 [Enterococcus sp. PF1-24]|uniref:DUF3114 domain-containing protein n=1 Tax=unclassified Enterococcus TaxID=2608891 RepID=UPI002473459D|nr:MULTISPECIES: DUF3114 domain-containing protein [unclassified Enterococcus]MDH6365025.1 hypothetical protein [Enterococcus sp. PFB1-1]MDH6402126.1 hypothetical protein [Enterococcus sp. PF1-24]